MHNFNKNYWKKSIFKLILLRIAWDGNREIMTLKLTVMTRTGIVERKATTEALDFLVDAGDERAKKEKLRQVLSETRDDSDKLRLVINYLTGD